MRAERPRRRKGRAARGERKDTSHQESRHFRASYCIPSKQAISPAAQDPAILGVLVGDWRVWLVITGRSRRASLRHASREVRGGTTGTSRYSRRELAACGSGSQCRAGRGRASRRAGGRQHRTASAPNTAPAALHQRCASASLRAEPGHGCPEPACLLVSATRPLGSRSPRGMFTTSVTYRGAGSRTSSRHCPRALCPRCSSRRALLIAGYLHVAATIFSRIYRRNTNRPRGRS